MAAGVWIYGPALRGGWIWADTAEVTQNGLLRDPAGGAKAWVAPADRTGDRAIFDGAELHCNLATAPLRTGRRTEAMAHCAAALRLRPDDDETRRLPAALRAGL